MKGTKEVDIIEIMENLARKFGMFSHTFTTRDTITVTFHDDWVEGTQFVYKHNDVEIDRNRVRDLIPS